MKEIKCPNCGTMFTIDEAGYAAILQQIKTAEFDNELKARIEEVRKSDKQAQQIAMQEQEKKSADVIRQREAEIAELRLQLKGRDGEQKTAVLEETLKAEKALAAKDAEIARIKKESEVQLKAAQEQVDFYKDMKTRMSTKMVGESLEVHCSNLFNQMLRPMMPFAYFEKDNEVINGTKGDFVFRDKDAEGLEYISIMFEMKNEGTSEGKKHKNEDFFKKLDEDRKNKGCEYAVLVSLLEPDSELYNGGIVDVSYRFPKMYVIRPQFFLPIITLLTQAAKNGLEYKKQLEIARLESVDVTNFEDRLKEFQDGFGKNCRLAKDKFEKAILEIDKSIKALQATKDALLGSEKNLQLADNKLEDLSIKKLTRDNKTMQERFAKAKKQGKDTESVA